MVHRNTSRDQDLALNEQLLVIKGGRTSFGALLNQLDIIQKDGQLHRPHRCLPHRSTPKAAYRAAINASHQETPKRSPRPRPPRHDPDLASPWPHRTYAHIIMLVSDIAVIIIQPTKSLHPVVRIYLPNDKP